MMSLCDFPFSTEMLGGRTHDSRTYPLHTEVARGSALANHSSTIAVGPALASHFIIEWRQDRYRHLDTYLGTCKQKGEGFNSDRLLDADR
jgi:hypothetical protein